MSHAVKVQTEIKDRALAKKVAAKLGYSFTEKGTDLVLNIKSRYGVPFTIHADGSSEFDRSFDCREAGNAIQKFMTEYTSEFMVNQLQMGGYNAFRTTTTTDAHGNAVVTMEVM